MTQKDAWIYAFDSPPPGDLAARKKRLGGKGAGLCEMGASGFPVPPGFVITTSACQYWVESGGEWPPGLEEALRRALAGLEEETGRKLGRGPNPLLVSVRSGAAVSMPGMMDTLLNCGLHPGLAEEVTPSEEVWARYAEFIAAFAETVHGIGEDRWPGEDAAPRERAETRLDLFAQWTGQAFPTDPYDALHACVEAVFASWNSERAVAYRRHHGLTHLAGTAVTVQAMWPSQVSGITFTRDPNAVEENRMVVESAFGLGEAVVSGEVTPDRFHLDRDTLEVRDREIGYKRNVCPALGQPPVSDPEAPSLDDGPLRELGEICLRLEEWAGRALDVEWGWVEGSFAILQSRPVQGLEAARAVEPLRRAEIERLRDLAGGKRKLWVTHNLDETLRFPTPLTWEVVSDFMSGSGGFGRMYAGLGYRPSAEVKRRGFLESIGGRIYADPERLSGLFFDGLPMRYNLDLILEDRSRLDSAPSEFNPDAADGRFLTTLPRNLAAMARTAKAMKREAEEVEADYAEKRLPAFLAYVEEAARVDLVSMTDEEVLEEVASRRERVLNDFAPASLLPGFFGGLAYGRLAGLLSQLFGEEEGGALARTLTSGLENDTTLEQDQLLHEVAEGKADREHFLQCYGHRCVGEMELARPRWREDPSYIHQSLARLAAAETESPMEIHARQRRRREEAEEALPGKLQRMGGLSFLPKVRRDLAAAQRLLPYRESGKHALMMGYALIRDALEVLARRWELGGDLYYLTLEELPRFPKESEALREAIRERSIRHQACRRLDMPEIIDSSDLEDLGLEPDYEDDANELEATAVAPGIGIGTAHIVLDPSEAGRFPEDAVLVCPSTDPAWTPLFMRARALVVERGGVLSHGAIVARNIGIPAVVCAGATRRLPEGARVRVDGQKGRIRILEEEEVSS